jgi:hypothetical protein
MFFVVIPFECQPQIDECEKQDPLYLQNSTLFLLISGLYLSLFFFGGKIPSERFPHVGSQIRQAATFERIGYFTKIYALRLSSLFY